MNVVDSSAWLEYFADGPNASHFAEPIEDFDSLLVPTIVIYEVTKVLLRERGQDEALVARAHLERARVVDLSAELAAAAAVTSLDLGLPMADSLILVTARAHDSVLWTQDEDFRELSGVRYFPV